MKLSADSFKKFVPFIVLTILAIAFSTWQFSPKAESAVQVRENKSLENYDIRTDKSTAAKEMPALFTKQSAHTDTAKTRTIRAKEKLLAEFPNVKIEDNETLRIPEVIAPDFNLKADFLTTPSSGKRADILRNFINRNSELFGLSETQILQLNISADYTNPNGNLSFVHFEQTINDTPVFQGEVKAGFTKRGEIIRIINNLAPGLNYETLSEDFGSAEIAVENAARAIGLQTNETDTKRIKTESNNLKITFERGQFAGNTIAEKFYFPIDSGAARTAWRVLLWTSTEAFYVVVDAESGTLLWRKNLTENQTQPATYNLYGNLTSMMKTADSPAPATPGCLMPNPCPQQPIINRTNFTLIGNEPPYNFNNNGWIPDGENRTIGNAAEAGIDRDGMQGVDPNGWAFGSPNRNFVYAYNPAPGNPAPGEEPLPTTQTYPPSQFQQGSITNAFYTVNRWHDEMYRLGFTEQAGNFQIDNFGRGGVANDSISVEVQDSSGTNNANFATPADGGRGRLQLFIWNSPTPDRDGALDAQLIVHEATHGVSNRLHGNGLGLGTNMARSMGEGWSDFYALALLSEPTDDINGTYSFGCYVLYQIIPGYDASCYYGFRRFPTARIAARGPNGLPHNALTFRYINVDCNILIGTTTTNPNSAFPRGPIGVSTCDQLNNMSEVWTVTLWEVRAQLIDAYGAAEGNRRVLQYVTDAMKLSPLNPTMLQSRDAIITAAFVSASADAPRVREGFRIRGMGFSASIQNVGTGNNNTVVTEAFDTPTVANRTATVTSGNNLLEPNECNTLNVPLINNSGDAATSVSAVLSSNTPGITVTQANSAYPNISGGGTATNITPYEVSIDASVACFTAANFTLTATFSGSGGGSPATYNFSLPIGLAGNNYVFTQQTGQTIPADGTLVTGSQADDAAVTIPLPNGWNSTIYGVAVTSLTANTNGSLTANGTSGTNFTNTALPANLAASNPTLLPYWDDMDMDPTDTTGGGIYMNTVGTAPNRQIYIEWKATHFSETSTTISTNFAILLTENSDVVRYIYALTGVDTQLNGASSTVGLQRQATGTQFTQFSFNQASLSAGLQLTAVRQSGQCTPGTATCAATNDARADFDGDGKTDLSVFRPAEGNWYLNRSTAGFSAVNWGISSDRLVPGDYDGDVKTDTVVYRNGSWYILQSGNLTLQAINWGLASDIPVAGDYDGDGKTDAAVFRPSNGIWYVLKSSDGQFTATPFGQSGDIPINGDFDGDGRNDLVVYRGGTWYLQKSAGGFTAISFGLLSDNPVPADYDGDGRDDIAVFRFTEGIWYRLNSSNGQFAAVQFGLDGDIPVPGDYDGDGKDDQAVYRNGTWYMNRSTAGFSAAVFGTPSDKPIPKYYLP